MKRTFLLLLATMLVGIGFAQNKLVFTPHWLPQAQFAGYYVALEKGFYKELGIDVEIKHISASEISIDELYNKEADIISSFLITAIDHRTEATPIVNIFQLSQHSSLLIASKKASGINSLSDLDGKNIGIWKAGFDEIPKTLLKENNYNVSWTPVLSSTNLFLLDGLDGVTVTWYNEYNRLIHSGINPEELNTFFMKDYGYNIPEDGIYCLEQTRQERAGDLKKFIAASQKGWEYAKKNKKEAVSIVSKVMKKEHVPYNAPHQMWMLNCTLELMEPGYKNVLTGQLSEADFVKAKQILKDHGSEKPAIFYNDFYKPLNR